MTSLYFCVIAGLVSVVCFDAVVGGGYGGAPEMESGTISEGGGGVGESFPDSSMFGGGGGAPIEGGAGGGDAAPVCVDEFDEPTCTGFSDDDACEDEPGQMFAICKKTCEMCDTCRDFESCCPFLKEGGGCGSEWMTINCPLSCDKCEKPDGWFTHYPHFVRAFGRPTVGGECEMEGYAVAVWNEIADSAKQESVSFAQPGEPTFTAMVTEMTPEKVNSATGPFTIPKDYNWEKHSQRQAVGEYTTPYVDEEKIVFVFKKGECGVKNFKQLVASDFKWVVVEGGPVDAWLKGQKGEPYSQAKSAVEYVPSEIKGCQRAATGKYIYIEEKLVAKATILNECAVDLTVTEETTGALAATVVKGFEGLADINKAIEKLKAKKAFEKIEKAWLTQNC